MERNLVGMSAVIASCALLIWSIGETFAYPQGPNVSLGSNPIAASVAPTQLDELNQSTFVITDLASLNKHLLFYVGGTDPDLRSVFIEHSPISYVTKFISPGDFIHCSSNAVFSGYYTH